MKVINGSSLSFLTGNHTLTVSLRIFNPSNTQKTCTVQGTRYTINANEPITINIQVDKNTNFSCNDIAGLEVQFSSTCGSMTGTIITKTDIQRLMNFQYLMSSTSPAFPITQDLIKSWRGEDQGKIITASDYESWWNI